jgi:hypothetical protein
MCLENYILFHMLSCVIVNYEYSVRVSVVCLIMMCGVSDYDVWCV